MPTNLIMQPGMRYRVTKSGVPSTTLTRNGGVSSIPATGYLRKTGDVVAIADGVLYCDQPIDVSVDLGSVTPTDGAFSVLTGATAALRRVVNTVGTTASPTLATDGYAVDGYASASIIMQGVLGGNVTFELWAYDSVSETWGVCFDFGSTGQQIVNNQIYRIAYSLQGKSLERLYLKVHANPGANQANAWIKLVPPLTTY